MPSDAAGLSLIRDVKELQRLARRHRNRNVSGAAIWDYQEFTTAGPNTLRYLPVNLSPKVRLNGVGLREGVDYTWDYSTGVITLTAAFTAGDKLMVRYQTTGNLIVAATAADYGGPYGDPTDLQILSNAAKLGASPPGGAGRYWGWVETGRQYNDVTATIHDPANETAYVACLIANPNTGALGYIAATGGGGTVGYAWSDPITSAGASGPLGAGTHTAYTLRAALSSSGVLTVYQNGTSVGTADIATANPTAWANLQAATKVGFGVQAANTNVTLDSWQTTDGLWSDSFNRANQQGLGSLDTGQVWSYDP